MILSVKSLEHFTLDNFLPWEYSEQFRTQIDIRVLLEALNVHAKTLISLDLACSVSAQFSPEILFTNIAKFHSLKRLAITEPLLLHSDNPDERLTDVLPPNLKDLQIQYPSDYLLGNSPDEWRALRVGRMKELAEAVPTKFKSLKRVIWWYQPAECWDGNKNYGPHSDMEILKTAFEEVGVKFVWLTDAFYTSTPIRRALRFWELRKEDNEDIHEDSSEESEESHEDYEDSNDKN